MTRRIDALSDEDGRIDRQVPARAWTAFPVQLMPDDTGVLILCERADMAVRRVRYRTGMFERFLQLADKDDLAIAAFANQFGRLELCRHGMPVQLAGACPELRATAAGFSGFMAEKPEHWRAWARRFVAAASVARHLSDATSPPEQDISTLMGGLEHHANAAITEAALKGTLVAPRKESAVLQAWWFCNLFNSWLSTQVVMTDVEAGARRLRLEHGSRGLFGTLALQAALVATGSRGFAVCSNCGRGYVPDRQPSAGDRAYCSDVECRVRAKNRDAAADKRLRDRKRETNRRRKRQ